MARDSQMLVPSGRAMAGTFAHGDRALYSGPFGGGERYEHDQDAHTSRDPGKGFGKATHLLLACLKLHEHRLVVDVSHAQYELNTIRVGRSWMTIDLDRSHVALQAKLV